MLLTYSKLFANSIQEKVSTNSGISDLKRSRENDFMGNKIQLKANSIKYASQS